MPLPNPRGAALGLRGPEPSPVALGAQRLPGTWPQPRRASSSSGRSAGNVAGGRMSEQEAALLGSVGTERRTRGLFRPPPKHQAYHACPQTKTETGLSSQYVPFVQGFSIL